MYTFSLIRLLVFDRVYGTVIAYMELNSNISYYDSDVIRQNVVNLSPGRPLRIELSVSFFCLSFCKIKILFFVDVVV